MVQLGEEGGIAVLQVIIFPFVFAAALFIWSRTGWAKGAKIWRYPATLSLLRIAGAVGTFVAIHEPLNADAIRTEYVCQLIGLAPLLLTYIGIMRQIDSEERIPQRPLAVVTILAFIGLILGIAGVSSADTKNGQYVPGSMVKASMGLFIAVFVITVLLTSWLFVKISSSTMRRFQKKLFMASALSAPFILVRVIYSALGDYDSSDDRFSIGGNRTVYLCMDVLEEIVAMAITMGFGMSAVLEKDFVRVGGKSAFEASEPEYNGVQV